MKSKPTRLIRWILYDPLLHMIATILRFLKQSNRGRIELLGSTTLMNFSSEQKPKLKPDIQG